MIQLTMNQCDADLPRPGNRLTTDLASAIDVRIAPGTPAGVALVG